MSSLEEFVKTGLEVSEKAREAWSIDLYRSLAQPIEKRLPVERFIDHARENYPKALRVIRRMREKLEAECTCREWGEMKTCLEKLDAELAAGEFDAE